MIFDHENRNTSEDSTGLGHQLPSQALGVPLLRVGYDWLGLGRCRQRSGEGTLAVAPWGEHCSSSMTTRPVVDW